MTLASAIARARRSLRRYVGKTSCLALLLCLGGAGCEPSGGSAQDDERDPHFLTGKSRKMAMDYTGAIDAFERALQNNPRSAAAHFELGLIYYERLHDWAAAIYHLERFRQLQPDSNKSDAVRQLIAACKQELVKDVPLGSLNQQVQRELEKLVQTNKLLLQQVEQLKIQLAQRPPTPLTSTPAPPLSPSNAASFVVASTESPPAATRSTSPAAPADTIRRPPAARSHTVKLGETPYAIARSYGIPVSALLAANPGLDPKRLKPGQNLNLPSP